MIASQRILTADERRLMDRGHALHQLVSLTEGIDSLSHRAEHDIRAVTAQHLDEVLGLADSATVARLELEAIDRRLDNHVQAHEGCSLDGPCWKFGTIQARRLRLQEAYDAAYRALVRGRH